MCQGACERIEEAPCRQDNQDHRKPKGEPDVLANDAAGGIGQADEFGQASEIGAEESHIGTAEGHLVELGADGHTNVRAAESRRIVDSIADHHDGPARGLLGAHDFKLLGGENFGNDLVHPQYLPNFTSHRCAISGEQDQAVDTQRPHSGKGIPRLAAGLIAQHQASRHRPP